MKILVNSRRNKYDHIAADEFYPEKFEGDTLCGTWVNMDKGWECEEHKEENYFGLCSRCWAKLQRIRYAPPPKMKEAGELNWQERAKAEAQAKLDEWNRAVARG